MFKNIEVSNNTPRTIFTFGVTEESFEFILIVLLTQTLLPWFRVETETESTQITF